MSEASAAPAVKGIPGVAPGHFQHPGSELSGRKLLDGVHSALSGLRAAPSGAAPSGGFHYTLAAQGISALAPGQPWG